MPLITTSVPNLVQGVSQQPDNLRYPGQAEAQKNGYSTVVDGLTKRPNSRLIAEIKATAINDDAKVHYVDRDTSNQHVAVFDDGGGSTVSVSIFNVATGAGIPATVTSAAVTYLSTTNPLQDIRALTVADYTFLVNKTKTVAMAGTTSAALAEEAVVFVKQGDYEKKYTVTLDGADKTVTSGASSVGGDEADSEHIAAEIVTAMGTVSGYTFTRNGSVIKIAKTSGMTIAVSDGLANTGLGLVFKEVDAITDLPTKCYNDFRVKVRGDVELTQDDYYVKFATKDGASFGEGSWVEDIGYGVTTTLDNTTMPVTMKPHMDGSGVITSYTVELSGETSATTAWTNRVAGDADTNGNPSFVGSTINDIFFFKNRLGLLADGAVVFSESDSYFNFFRTTVLSLLDGDPIDVGVAHTKVSILKHAVPFQEKLVLFAPKSQFVLRGTDLLTPRTVNVSPITEYDVNENVTPLALSNYVYFPFQRGGYDGIYEFFIDKDTDVFDASEITAQTPRYLSASLRQIVGTPSEDVIVTTTSSNLKHLYVYKYFWQNKEKIQSAWSRFEFATDVVGVGFMGSDLYMVTKDSGGTYLEKVPMEVGLTDTGKSYAIHLDRRLDGASLSDSYATSKTTITGLPYDPDGAVVYTKNGARYPTTRVSATSCTLSDIASFVSHGGTVYRCIAANTSASATEPGVGGSCASYWVADSSISSASAWSVEKGYISRDDYWLGFEYDTEYEFSTQTLKQPTERGGKSASDFTYQTLKNGAVDYADTGHFTIEVTPLYRDTYSYAFNPSNLGADSTVGSLVLDSGSFRFPIHAKHDEATVKITTSSALPMKILAAEFESFVNPRSKRYGG